MVVRILDHVTGYSTYDDGNVIFDIIAPEISRGSEVVLSFEGINAVPSSFINAAIVRLVEVVPSQAVKARLKIVDSTKQINDLIRGRFEFLAESEKAGRPN